MPTVPYLGTERRRVILNDNFRLLKVGMTIRSNACFFDTVNMEYTGEVICEHGNRVCVKRNDGTTGGGCGGTWSISDRGKSARWFEIIDVPNSPDTDFSAASRIFYNDMMAASQPTELPCGTSGTAAPPEPLTTSPGVIEKSAVTKPMTDIIGYLKRIGMSESDKAVIDAGLENPLGTPTELGLQLSAMISYKANREAIVKLAQDMKAEADKDKK